MIAEIRKGGMAHRSTLQSFDWRTLRIAQREAPEIPTVYLTAQQKFFDNVCTGAAAGSPDVPPPPPGPPPPPPPNWCQVRIFRWIPDNFLNAYLTRIFRRPGGGRGVR